MAHTLNLLAEKYTQVVSEEHEDDKKHKETDMSNPEERTEVHIAREILSATDMEKVKTLAKELLKMHGQE